MGVFDFLKKKEFETIKSLNLQLEKYKPVIDIETECEKLKANAQAIKLSSENEINILQEQINSLKSKYQNALEIYNKLKNEISLYESKLDLIEFGIYEPIYDFEKSDDYREKQNIIIEKQKKMISDDNAAICESKWMVENSAAKGEALIKKYKKLMLKAFNGECDVLISKVKWNNVNQMKERMNKQFESINKIGEGFHIKINKKFLDLKVAELTLEYEYNLKKQEEKEKLKAIQDELREEEKARKEYEKAQKEAEKEEQNYQKLLERAKKEYDITTGEEHEKLKVKIEMLERELKEAQELKARAISMAQQTKRGHVYIISNIGSFGENVYKIGMTRRLEPLDRIRELGDASVPFQFDIHALIFSEEAPTLEFELHKAFSKKKLNMFNYRKEFFNVTLDEIEAKIKEFGIEVEFNKTPEAMEYRETISILNKNSTVSEEVLIEEFPADLFE